jgi:hypothetical protein
MNDHHPDHPDDPDDLDGPLIAELRAMVAEADPVPALVAEAAKAAFGWRRLDADLAELLSDSTLDVEATALARGHDAPVRSVSFSSAQLTIDVEVHVDLGGGAGAGAGAGAGVGVGVGVSVDGERRTLLGQLSPPSSATVEVQRADDDVTTTVKSDSLGRFRAQVVAGRPIRLRVLSAAYGPAAAVETSWISI